MINEYTIKNFTKVFSICIIVLTSCNITNAHQNISLGCEWKYLFNTVRQIFDKNTHYGGKFKKEILNTIPMTYKIFTRYPVTNNNYNFKHNLQWHLISWKENKHLLNVAVANYLEEKNETCISKEVKSLHTHKIISSLWINIGVMYNLLEDKRDERRDCFCYGLGVNYSKMSIYYKEGEQSKKESKKTFYHHVWVNFSIFGKCLIGNYFSLGTTITMAFLIVKLHETGDNKIDIQTEDGTIIGYNFVPQGRFTLINPQPILTLTLYLEI